jgi:hypothetical protein
VFNVSLSPPTSVLSNTVTRMADWFFANSHLGLLAPRNKTSNAGLLSATPRTDSIGVTHPRCREEVRDRAATAGCHRPVDRSGTIRPDAVIH